MSYTPTHDIESMESLEQWDVSSMALTGMRIITARRGVVTWIVKRSLRAWTNDPWQATKMKGGRVLEQRELGVLPEPLRRYAR